MMNAAPAQRDNAVVAKSFAFALAIISLCRELTDAKEHVVSRQLLRSGTSIGANVEEAQAAQSRRDFASKMSIALKEARETRYWLRLLDQSRIMRADYKPALADCEEMIRLLTAIVRTSSGRSATAAAH